MYAGYLRPYDVTGNHPIECDPVFRCETGETVEDEISSLAKTCSPGDMLMVVSMEEHKDLAYQPASLTDLSHRETVYQCR